MSTCGVSVEIIKGNQNNGLTRVAAKFNAFIFVFLVFSGVDLIKGTTCQIHRVKEH
jgi:hypothetical protein